uniref:putative selenate ABC transporter substrate-binding protein n=1 Tax=Aestuariirhabdus haliotis TaxID=2918751 RepID=UPI0022286EBB|nr:putative selenate ABC transporter substrate-binding protein [Aestuariirhabdus haliotis]
METLISRFFTVTLMVLSLATFSGAASAETKTLVFSAIPDQDQAQLMKRFGKIATYLSKELGVPVKYVPVNSYAAAITAFRNDQIQLAWFGGLSGVRARLLVPDSQAIAQGYEDTEFVTYFIAHHSTGLQPTEEFPKAIAGKTFTFGSKGSTSGRLMPEYYIRDVLGKTPKELFPSVGFSGNHSRTIALVEAGSYQVGATNYKVWEKAVAAGKVDTSKVSVIWKTPTYPDYQWSIRGDVDAVWGEGFKERVKQALLNMEDKALLDAFPRSRFIEADNSDYQAILDTAKEIGLLD